MPDLTYTQRMERFVEFIAPVIVSHLVKMRRELSEKQAAPPPLQLLPPPLKCFVLVSKTKSSNDRGKVHKQNSFILFSVY